MGKSTIITIFNSKLLVYQDGYQLPAMKRDVFFACSELIGDGHDLASGVIERNWKSRVKSPIYICIYISK